MAFVRCNNCKLRFWVYTRDGKAPFETYCPYCEAYRRVSPGAKVEE